MGKLLVKDILEKINSAHHIRLVFEHKYGQDENEYIIDTVKVDIHTSVYGNPTTPVDKDLLDREIRHLFPMDGVLYLYLEEDIGDTNE